MYIVLLASLMQDIFNLPVPITSACLFTTLNTPMHIHIHISVFKIFLLSSCFPSFLPFFLFLLNSQRQKAIYSGLEGVFPHGNIPAVDCLSNVFGGRVDFGTRSSLWVCRLLSPEQAMWLASKHLKSVQNVRQGFLSTCGCHHPVRGGVCSLPIGVKSPEGWAKSCSFALDCVVWPSGGDC